MLSPKTQYNLANAKGYFEEHLSVGDYYTESQRVRGEWIGEGAALLGLEGAVRQEQFLALCENRHPGSGERLTQRHKTTRRDSDGEGEVANRRVFYDFTISPPKSVSVAALVSGDERIIAAHGCAVRLAVAELEKFTTTQVHEGGAHRDRHTGNFIAALFEHDTSRALDPHLHTHCILFNATHDATEDRWKALHNYSLLAAQKFVENAYYHELARSLRSFGYTVVNSARGDFQIEEIPSEMCERFSKRHREIDEKTHALLAANPDKRGGNVAEIREHIAHKERGRKLPAMPLDHLQQFWKAQLEPGERLGAPSTASLSDPAITAAAAVSWAEEHLFERRSVVYEHEIWRQALSFGRGAEFTVAELRDETGRRPYVRTENGKVSRQDVLEREWQLVDLARDGTCRHSPFTAPDSWQRDDLAPDQQQAFTQILSSADFVTLFRGGAGTGKSYVLRRVQEALDDAGRHSFVLAPQRQQVLDLGRDGLTGGQTVSEFLQRGAMTKGGVVIVDEAGQIGGEQLLALLQLVRSQGGRVILSGDTRQHGPVESSDALRAIERFAGLLPAELNSIRRQDPARGKTHEEQSAIASYREAVQAAADGDLNSSFETLDAVGAITECAAGEERARLTDAYLQLAASGESALVVSQTRSEIREVNEAIRAKLRSTGALGGLEHEVIALEPVDLTAAQKADPRFYPPDAVALLRRGKSAKSVDQTGKIIAITTVGVVLEVSGKMRTIRAADFDRLSIYRPRHLPIGAGDRLQLKSNAKSVDGRKLANGEIVTVSGVEQSGIIQLEDGRALPAQFRQFARGYAVTSYGSQGKTVDHVLFADSSARAATNAEQWYVTVSRGRKSVRIFTADKAQLADNIRRAGHRELAIDLMSRPQRSRRVRDRLLRGLRRGREFARRVCMVLSRPPWRTASRIRREVAITL